jgi:hypothetical protein
MGKVNLSLLVVLFDSNGLAYMPTSFLEQLPT